MKSPNLHVALVGAGNIGQHHLRQWQQIDQATIVGVHDRDADRAARVAKEFNIPRVYPTLDGVLGDDAVSAVDVCTPNAAHVPASRAALLAGKHVICEKPLGIDPADIETLIAARDQSGKLLMTGQHLRFEPQTQALKRVIDAGGLGDVYYARAWWLRRRRAPAAPTFLSRQEAGGGATVDLGVHLLDLVMHLLDHPTPVSVTGMTTTMLGKRPDLCNEWGDFKPDDIDVDEFAVGLVRFSNGLTLTLETSWLLNMIEPEVRRLWLFGSNAGAEWPELQLSHTRYQLMADTRLSPPPAEDGICAELRAFVSAINNGDPSPVPPEQSLVVARILAALNRAADTGCEVRLDT